MIIAATPESAGGSLGRALGLEANVRAAEVAELEAAFARRLSAPSWGG